MSLSELPKMALTMGMHDIFGPQAEEVQGLGWLRRGFWALSTLTTDGLGMPDFLMPTYRLVPDLGRSTLLSW